MENTTGRSLRDCVRVYQHAGLADMAGRLAGVSDWTLHGWYNSTTRTMHSEPDKELSVMTPPPGSPLNVAITEAATDSVRAYCSELMPIGSVNNLSFPRLNRYEAGTCMRAHVDHIHSLFDGSQRGIPALTVLGGLSASTEYQGGAFNLCGAELLLEAGDVAVFPSCFLFPHEVEEVTAGTRYSFVSWAW
jgi:hypothetical protein